MSLNNMSEERGQRSSATNLSTVIYFIPLRKLPEPFPDPNLRSKPIIALQSSTVRVSDGNITRLHAYELPMTFEIVILGQDTRTNELFLEC